MINQEQNTAEFKHFLFKAEGWCARQDRCIFETKIKLNEWDCPAEYHEKIIDNLIESKFIDEERFTSGFVRGKFIYKHWGRNKIRYELKGRKIDHQLIEKALLEIDDEKYISTIDDLLEKKHRSVKEKDLYKLKSKLINYLMSKGYEYDIFKDRIEKIITK